MSNPPLQDRLFQEIKEGEVFKKALQYGYDYLQQVFDRNVYPTTEAIENLDKFNEKLPEKTSKPIEVLDQLQQYGAPATVPTLGGRYFGFVSGSSLPIGLAAKTLSTYWDQSPGMHVLSPIGSKLESVVELWLTSIFGLPTGTVAGFVSGSSTANICGIMAARFRILQKNNWDVNKKGLYDAPKIRVVTGKHAHSTVLKAIGILGLGHESIEWVNVDDQGRIITDQVPDLDQNTILILQAGNVNSGAYDDFESLCAQANEAGSWVHIDGAFGLWAEAVQNLRHLTKGIGLANSWAVDGHKTLNTPYDSGIVLCEDKEALASALHMSGSYIVESEERDGMFFTPEMSRRARVIELWATMKYLGKSGMEELILQMHLRAKQFAQEIGSTPGFYVDNEVVFNQVIVRCESDEITEAVMKNVQSQRDCWAGGSRWFEKKVIRVSICSWATTQADVTKSLNSFKAALIDHQESKSPYIS